MEKLKNINEQIDDKEYLALKKFSSREISFTAYELESSKSLEEQSYLIQKLEIMISRFKEKYL